MAERFPQKIAVFTMLLSALLADPAHAKEEFVKYEEARAVLGTTSQPVVEPGRVQQEELRAELERGEPVLLFDARTKKEYGRERLPGAKLPRNDEYYKNFELFQQKVVREAPSSKTALERATKGFSRTTTIVTYCHARCGLSKTLKLELEALGFTNVRWLDGGIDVWREKGYPIEKSE